MEFRPSSWRALGDQLTPFEMLTAAWAGKSFVATSAVRFRA